MSYKVQAWSWCADYCKKKGLNPHFPENWDEALLQYRRQHNIFEVGDKVVFKNVEKFKDNMLQVAHIELQKVLDIKSGLNGYTSFDELRHAEPEELEAGKRLEGKA